MLLLKWLPKQSRLSSLPRHLYSSPPVLQLASQNLYWGYPRRYPRQVPRPFRKGLCQQSLPLASSAIGMQRLMATVGGGPQTYVSVSYGVWSTSTDCRMLHWSQRRWAASSTATPGPTSLGHYVLALSMLESPIWNLVWVAMRGQPAGVLANVPLLPHLLVSLGFWYKKNGCLEAGLEAFIFKRSQLHSLQRAPWLMLCLCWKFLWQKHKHFPLGGPQESNPHSGSLTLAACWSSLGWWVLTAWSLHGRHSLGRIRAANTTSFLPAQLFDTLVAIFFFFFSKNRKFLLL